MNVPFWWTIPLNQVFFFVLSSHFISAFSHSLSYSLSSIQFSHSNLLSSAFISPFSVEFKLLSLSLSLSLSVSLWFSCVCSGVRSSCVESRRGVISLSDVLISITESCAHSYSQTLLELHLQDRGLTHTHTHTYPSTLLKWSTLM